MDEEKIGKLRDAASMLGVETKQVAPEDTHYTVGYLAGIDGYEAVKAEGDTPAEQEFLLMCGFSRMQFEAFMNFFKKRKISPVALKAMMTETNRDWVFSKLVEAVEEEHRFMTRQKQ